MVGGGVLSLPFAMSQPGTRTRVALGLWRGVAWCWALAASCCLPWVAWGPLVLPCPGGEAWTLSMLVDCARATGRDSFELVGHAAYGEVSRKVTIAPRSKLRRGSQ